MNYHTNYLLNAGNSRPLRLVSSPSLRRGVQETSLGGVFALKVKLLHVQPGGRLSPPHGPETPRPKGKGGRRFPPRLEIFNLKLLLIKDELKVSN